ncbi:MAG: tetratricopeptide repeat protein, partial [Bacteroidales bacterium]|nr:tetratricopeptide repeat protein [Bacteroidales bacterium]
MNKIYAILFFIFVPLNSFNLLAQKDIDSLETVLKTANDEDKALVMAKLASLYYKEPEKRFSYARQALKLADEYDIPRAKSLALYSLSQYYLSKNNQTKAQELADSNIVVSLASLDSSSISNAYYFYGFFYSSQADYNNAALYYKKALEYTPYENKVRKYSLMQSYAITLNNLSNYEEALKILLKVITYYEETGNIESAAHIYHVLGAIFVEMEDAESAKKYFHKALQLAKKANYNFVLGETMLGLGSLYSDEKMIDSAKFYLLSAKKYAEKDVYYSLIADINTALGDLYLDINNMDSALIYYNEVIKLSEKINDNWAIVYGYMGLAKVYNKEQNYGKSLFYLYKVEPIAQKVNANELLIDFYDIFSQTLALSGNYREAYHYMKLYNQYSDKFYKEKSAHELTNLKVAYETEKKEQENRRLQAENKFKEQNIKNQRYINISIALLLLLTLFFAISFFRDKKKIQKTHKLLVEKNSEILNQNEEIKLKSEEVSKAYTKLKELEEYRHGLTNIIIHDLKNPLNIILNMADNKLEKEA